MMSIFIYFLVLTFFTYANSSDVYTFGDCSKPKNNVFKTDGARVKSQLSRLYKGDNLNCTLIFKAKEASMTFHLILLDVDIPSISNKCEDSLTIKAHDQDLKNSTMVLERFCGQETNEGLVTEGHYLEITWVGSKVTKGHVGFNLVITAVKNSQGPCDTSKYFECDRGFCISSSLYCDGTYNCPDRKDEMGCFTTAELVGKPVVSARPTRPPDLSSTTAMPSMVDSVYLWLPLMVVLVFTIVMVSLILMGRGSDTNNNTVQQVEALLRQRKMDVIINRFTTEDPDDDDDDEDDEFDAEMDSVSIMIVVGVLLLIALGCFLIGCRKREAAGNLVQNTLLRRWSGRSRDPNYRGGDGRPATPPPSYSFIERQTSYVSDISITSSQLSFPPEYDEAIDMPDEPGSQQQRPRRMRFLSRQSSSRRGPRVTRVGTFSPGDINARRGSRLQRSMSDGERPRPMSETRRHPQRTSSGTSQQGGNVPVPPLRFRIESTASSIFEHDFEDDMSRLSPVGSAIMEEDDGVFSEAIVNQLNNSNGNDLTANCSTPDHRGDDSDTALLEDEDSDLPSPPRPRHSSANH